MIAINHNAIPPCRQSVATITPQSLPPKACTTQLNKRKTAITTQDTIYLLNTRSQRERGIANADLVQHVIIPAFFDTTFMVICTFVISTIIGFVLAILMVSCDEYGLSPNPSVYKVLNVIVNVLRSFPFIILIVAMIPITRLIVGTSIGRVAAIVPLVFASAPFIARLVETSLKEVNAGVIEAAQSFGATNKQIIFKVMIKEAIPSIVLNLTLAIITILGLSAMAGTVGGGGLGSVAIIYGYQSFNQFAMYFTVAILIVVVQILQYIGNWLYKKLL